jgi:hypothetical protein
MQPRGAVPPAAVPAPITPAPTAAPPPVEPAGTPPAAPPPVDPYAPTFADPGPTPYGAAPYGSPWAAGYVAAEPPRPQLYVSRRTQASTSRLTVAFRLLLAIPHLLVWAIAGEVIGIVAIVAWFAALFTARVPMGIYQVIAWYVGYTARVSAYLTFLSDRWPGFSESSDEPVTVWLQGPDKLNRAAVFFRLILVIPAAALVQLISAGVALASPVLWLVVLISGRVPRPLFNASASVVRYGVRYYAYYYLLTAAYPGGLYGDPVDRREEDEPPATVETPSAETSSAERPPAEAPRPPVLHRSARRLVTVFIALGAVVVVGYFVAVAVFASGEVDRLRANNELANAYHSINAPSMATCTGSSDRLGCFKQTASQDAQAFSEFAAAVRDISFPSDVRPEVNALLTATDQFDADFKSLAGSNSLEAFRAFSQSHNLEAEGQAVDDAVRTLSQALVTGG